MTSGGDGEPPQIGQTADEVGCEWHAASLPEAPIGRGARLGYDVASRDSQAGAESVQQGGDGDGSATNALALLRAALERIHAGTATAAESNALAEAASGGYAVLGGSGTDTVRFASGNVALFGKTAQEWREANPDLPGNMRDHASIEQLLVLANIEGLNAELIRMKLTQGERLQRLNSAAIRQMQVLTIRPARLPGMPDEG